MKSNRARFFAGFRLDRHKDSLLCYYRSMKTTIDIPEDVLRDAMRYSKAKTKRDAVVTAVEYYNRRQRMAALTRHLGTCNQLLTPEELRHSRHSE